MPKIRWDVETGKGYIGNTKSRFRFNDVRIRVESVEQLEAYGFYVSADGWLVDDSGFEITTNVIIDNIRFADQMEQLYLSTLEENERLRAEIEILKKKIESQEIEIEELKSSGQTSTIESASSSAIDDVIEDLENDHESPNIIDAIVSLVNRIRFG